MKKILSDLNFSELKILITQLQQPNFRAKQLWDWIVKGANFKDITNMPKSFIELLEKNGYVMQGVKVLECLMSNKDDTKKYLFQLEDDNIIEGVFMKYKYGNTLCVSTQVGCRMNCTFCASGLGGLIRNLTAGEILSQILAVNYENQNVGQKGITNVVLMGSGEPLDNYNEVTKFLTLVSDEQGINISKRNISLSTCGLCDKIMQLADDGFCPTMTISLHAPNDELRKAIMPIANKFSVKEIIKAVRYYFEKTGRRIIFEYCLIEGKNDSKDCANQLADLVKGLPCHINLIKLNHVKEKNLISTSSDNINKFLKHLESRNISCTLRRNMGSDIDGACGQLRRKYIQSNS